MILARGQKCLFAFTKTTKHSKVDSSPILKISTDIIAVDGMMYVRHQVWVRQKSLVLFNHRIEHKLRLEHTFGVEHSKLCVQWCRS